MHPITALMTGLLAAGLVTSAGAVLAVLVHAAGIERRLGSTARSRVSAGALKFIGATHSDGATQ
jgi:hypothetical protein